MSDLNKMLLSGRLVRDPELRYLQSGTAVCNFSVATNRKYKNQNTNELVEEVTFVDITAWGKTGENISKFFSKGQPILVEGRMSQSTWEDKATGQKRSKLFVTLEQFHFFGTQRNGNGGTVKPNSEEFDGGYTGEDLPSDL